MHYDPAAPKLNNPIWTNAFSTGPTNKISYKLYYHCYMWLKQELVLCKQTEWDYKLSFSPEFQGPQLFDSPSLANRCWQLAFMNLN